MQNVMADEVEDAKNYINWMIKEGAFDCETHLLWNKLLCSTPQVRLFQIITIFFFNGELIIRIISVAQLSRIATFNKFSRSI